jgi:hypothetical protein
VELGGGESDGRELFDLRAELLALKPAPVLGLPTEPGDFWIFIVEQNGERVVKPTTVRVTAGVVWCDMYRVDTWTLGRADRLGIVAHASLAPPPFPKLP